MMKMAEAKNIVYWSRPQNEWIPGADGNTGQAEFEMAGDAQMFVEGIREAGGTAHAYYADGSESTDERP
jgi:hypothetical protein